MLATVTDEIINVPGSNIENPALPPAPPVSVEIPADVPSLSSIDSLLDIVGGVIDFSVGILNYIIENPILVFGLAASLIPVGLKVFKIMKRSVK